MVIVHVVRQFFPSVGGLENHVLDLARAQQAAGHRVRIVTLNRLFKDETQKTLPSREMLDGMEIVRIPFRGSPRYPIAPSTLRHVRDADIVHVHAIDFFFDFLAWTQPFHRRPLVATTHGGFFHTAYAARLKRIWFPTVTRASSRFYAAVIACSASDFQRFQSICPDRVVQIDDGVDTTKFRGASAGTFAKSILSIGRFSENKRIDLLVRFLQTLTARDPQWRLTIAGRPDDLSLRDVGALVASAGLEGAVTVVDSPSDEELRHLMGDSAFLASASDYEGFGMASIEGMSAGLFPLLSLIPPFRRLVEQTGLGLLLDYRNPDDAAHSLLERAGAIAARYPEQRSALHGCRGRL